MISFTKYHGAGNDFILIDDRKENFPITKELITLLCHRKFGIGADGLILAQESEKADIRMRIFNSDGLEADHCGNGMRCFLRFMYTLGFPVGRYLVALNKESTYGEIDEETVRVYLKKPSSFQRVMIEGNEVFVTNTGVEHAVIFVDSVRDLHMQKVGPFYRAHPLLGPNGANVNFVEKKDDHLLYRVFERGVEAETLSCGTGVAAAAFFANTLFQYKNPIQVVTSGGEFVVSIQDSIILQGEPAFVFKGEFCQHLSNICV
jgi:diaminopimelate epimerase